MTLQRSTFIPNADRSQVLLTELTLFIKIMLSGMLARKQRIKKPLGQEQQWRTSRKRMRGEGVFYEESKSETVQAALTPTAKARLKQLAALNKLSVSEYLERWLRGVDELILPP